MISIIVPVYRVENYLEQCLDSIICQNYSDLEILLIDDGSPDRCGEICDRYAIADSRIQVFHTENRGLSAARNLGIDNAHGAYLGFVDSDDWIEPNMYEELLSAMEVSGSDIAICGRVMEYPNKRKIVLPPAGVMNQEKSVKALALLEIRNPAWDKLWKRECFENIRFPEDRVYEDIATTYRVFLQIKQVVCVPTALYHYRKRDDSISNDGRLKSIVDLYFATKAEFEDIVIDSPYSKEEIIRKSLLHRCRSVVIKLWKSYCNSSNVERKRYYFELQDAVRFVKKNRRFFKSENRSIEQRVLLFLCQYPIWWSFAVTKRFERMRDIIKTWK